MRTVKGFRFFLFSAVAALMLAPPARADWIYNSVAETLTHSSSGVVLTSVTASGTNLTIGQQNQDASPLNGIDLTEPISDGSTSYQVTVIAAKAFFQCKNLSGDVVFPDTLTSFGQQVFENAGKSASGFTVTFGASAVPTSIYSDTNNDKNGDFKGSYVTKVDFSKLTGTVDMSADKGFRGCSKLAEVRMPKSVSNLGLRFFDMHQASYPHLHVYFQGCPTTMDVKKSPFAEMFNNNNSGYTVTKTDRDNSNVTIHIPYAEASEGTSGWNTWAAAWQTFAANNTATWRSTNGWGEDLADTPKIFSLPETFGGEAWWITDNTKAGVTWNDSAVKVVYWTDPLAEGTVTFCDYNGTVLQSGLVSVGTIPEYTGETPTRAASDTTVYTFAGWSPELETVMGDATYTAVYAESAADGAHAITWLDGGATLATTFVLDGSTPDYGSTLAKESTVQYDYTFAGWSTDGSTVLSPIPPATADATYIAVWTPVLRTYMITFENVDGSVLLQQAFGYGSTPACAVPEHPADEHGDYAFAGWTPALEAVTGPATYTATYAANFASEVWTLRADSGNTTMTNAAGRTLKVTILDAEARTIRIGHESTGNSEAKLGNAIINNDSWIADLSLPIQYPGTVGRWKIVEIGAAAFGNNKTIMFPHDTLDLSSVTNVGYGAFMYCQNFTRVILSPHLEEVGSGAFNQAFRVASFEPMFPPALKKIGANAFGHHTSYDPQNIMSYAGTVELRGVEEIYGAAFNNVPGVTNVIVGPHCSVLSASGAVMDKNTSAYSPFYGLTKLEEITFLGAPPEGGLPTAFLSDMYLNKRSADNTPVPTVDDSAVLVTTCYVYEDYAAGWRTAMAASGGTITDFTTPDNPAVFAKWEGGNDNRTILLAHLAGHPPTETEPVFDLPPRLTKSGGSHFVFTANLAEGRGALNAVFTDRDGMEYVFPVTAREMEGDTNVEDYVFEFDASLVGLPANKTYSFAVRGSNTLDEVSSLAGEGTFFFGTVNVSVSPDTVNEYDTTHAGLTITATRTGTDGELHVPLVIGGTAEERLNYLMFPHEITIPDGASSASVHVTPIISLETADTTLVAAPDHDGLFFSGTAATATIKDWDAPVLEDFRHQVTFTAEGCPLAQVEALKDFPVLIRLTPEQVRAVGSPDHLTFFQEVNSVSRLCPDEVEEWSEENGGTIWVGMHYLYTNAVVTMAWGTGHEYHEPNLSYALWHAAQYIGVWHLDETDGTAVVENSTEHGARGNGTAGGDTHAQSRGIVGPGRSLSDTKAEYGWIDVPAPDAYLNDVGAFTASFWVFQESDGASENEYLAGSTLNIGGMNGWVLRKDAITGDAEKFFSTALNIGTEKVYPEFSGTSSNRWAHYSVSFDNSKSLGYSYQMDRDGEVVTVNDHYVASTGGVISFGNIPSHDRNGLTGELDEIRLRKKMSTPAWLQAECDCVRNPDYMVEGPFPNVHTRPRVEWSNVAGITEIGFTNVVVGGVMTLTGDNENEADIECRIWRSGDAEPEEWTSITNDLHDGESFSIPVYGLADNTEYVYELRANNGEYVSRRSSAPTARSRRAPSRR